MVVPNLELEKVATTTPGEDSSQRSSARTLGMVGVAALGVAVAAGVAMAVKKRNQ